MPPIETSRGTNGLVDVRGGAPTRKRAPLPPPIITSMQKGDGTKVPPPARPEESTKPPGVPRPVPLPVITPIQKKELSPTPSTHSPRRPQVSRYPSTTSVGSLNTFYSSRRRAQEEAASATFHQLHSNSGEEEDEYEEDNTDALSYTAEEEFDGAARKRTSFQSVATASTAASGATRSRPLIASNASATWSLGSEEVTMDRLPKRVPRRGSGSHHEITNPATVAGAAVRVLDHGRTGPPPLPRRTIGREWSDTASAADGGESSTVSPATDAATSSILHQLHSSPDQVLDGDNNDLPGTNVPFRSVQQSDVGSAGTSPSQIFQALLTLKRQRGAFSLTDGASMVSSLSMATISMTPQSHLSFSPPVQSLLDLAATVVNSSSVDTALYSSAMQASGAQIVRLNKAKQAATATQHQQQKLSSKSKSKSSIASTTSDDGKAAYHRELRAIGTIMGLLRTRMSLIHCVNDEFEKAVEYCDGAIQIHSHQPTLKDHIKGIKLDEVDELSGLMLLIIERLKEARHALVRHFELLQRIDALAFTSGTEGGDASSSGGSVISMFMENLSPDATPREILFEVIEQSVRAEDESSMGLFDENMLEVLSVHAVENDRQDEAIKFLRDAIQIHLVALGLKHKTLGKSLIRIAKMYRGTGNDRENEKLVLGYFHQTAAVLKRSNLGNRERGSILNDIAVIHMRRADFDEAIKFLLDALHAYDEDAEEVQKAGRAAASLQVWRNLGECYMHLNKYRSAEGAFLKALDIQDTARRLQDTAESLDLAVIGMDKSLIKLISDSSIANTVCRIGRARAGGGDLRRALDLYKQALNVIHRGGSEDAMLSDQELLIKRDQLTEVFLLIADVCGALNEINKAFAAYRSALRLRTANGADKYDKRLQTRIHCLKCYGGISDLYMKLNEYDNAIKQLQEAIEYASAAQMNQDHVVVQSVRQKLAAAEHTLAVTPDRISQITQLERQADAEIENGTLDKATDTLRELLGLRRAMLKNMKDRGLDTTGQIYSIACLLQTFGFVFAKNGDDLNAEIAFKDASLLFKKTGRSSESATSPTRLSL